MGGHGHGHEEPYKVPHYTEFSTKDIPQLEELEQALAKKGLKDPWIRNEAWRYHVGFGTRWQRARKLFFRGAPAGFALAVVVTGLTYIISPPQHGHDGDHGHQH